MTEHTLTFTETEEAGITAAREAFNATLPLTDGQALADHPDFKASNTAYVQFVMSRAAESYCRQYGVT